MIRAIKVLILFGAIWLISCDPTPGFDTVPKISFVGLSKDTLKQGIFQEDTLTVVFAFEDGDGDLGRNPDGVGNNVFFTDSRTGQLDNTFAIPFIPQEGSTNGIEGEVRIKLFSTCCIFPNGQDPCTASESFPFDTLTYLIQVVDRAGNMSNEIETAPIILLCN